VRKVGKRRNLPLPLPLLLLVVLLVVLLLVSSVQGSSTFQGCDIVQLCFSNGRQLLV
jgi:hypothetical protein